MEQRIVHLLRQLIILGYQKLEIANIIEDAIGNSKIDNLNRDEQVTLVNQLERYKELGNQFSYAYSK